VAPAKRGNKSLDGGVGSREEPDHLNVRAYKLTGDTWLNRKYPLGADKPEREDLPNPQVVRLPE
jgi:hypothetical protein